MTTDTTYIQTEIQPANQTDLQRAFECIVNKRDEQTFYFDHYDGKPPRTEITKRLRTLLRGFEVEFSENWSAVVIDAVADRINLTGFQVEKNDSAQKLLNTIWSQLEIALEADDAHKNALIAGESFLIYWRNPETGELEFYQNDPRLCHAEYDPSSPNTMLWAAKLYEQRDGTSYMILYYPDRFEYYSAPKPIKDLSNMDSFSPDLSQGAGGVAENPFGIIPVFHLRPDRRKIKSDLVDVVKIQTAVTSMWIDLLVTMEYNALPMKYIITNAELDVQFQNTPNAIWEVPASDGQGQPTQVGQFQAADPNVLLTPINTLIDHLAAITKIPKFFILRQGGDPSGEALKTSEAALNSKVQDRIDRFKVVWRRVAHFILLTHQMDVPIDAITPLYDDPGTVQPLTQAQIMQLQSSMLPLRTVLRLNKFNQAQIDQIFKDKQTEQEEQLKQQADQLAIAQGGQDPNASLVQNQTVSGLSQSGGPSDSSQQAANQAVQNFNS